MTEQKDLHWKKLEFVANPENHKAFVSGRLVRVPIIYNVEKAGRVNYLKQKDNGTASANRYTYELDPSLESIDKAIPYVADPSIGLSQTEKIIAYKFKRRPGLIINDYRFEDLYTGDSKFFNEHYFIVPLYSLTEEIDESVQYKSWADPSFRNDWLYPCKIPFMAPIPKCTEAGLKKESMLRFDRIQVLHKTWIKPQKFKLSEFGVEWLKDYLLYSLDHDIDSKSFIYL